MEIFLPGDLRHLIPELLLLLGILVTSVTVVVPRLLRISAVVAYLVVVASTLMIATGLGTGAVGAFASGAFGGPDPMLIRDDFARATQLLCGVGALLSLPLIEGSRFQRSQAYLLLLAALLGGQILCLANSLLLAYGGIELLWVALAGMCHVARGGAASDEAAMKVVLVGGATSALMLVGIAFLFGTVGTTNFGEMLVVLARPNLVALQSYPFTIGLLLLLVGVAARTGLAPFHYWLPDAVEGGPRMLGAFTTTAGIVSGMALLARFVTTAVPPLQGFDWQPILAVVAILSMAIGGLAALRQNRLSRLLGYGAIANTGLLMAGLVTLQGEGLAAMLTALACHVVGFGGAFLALDRLQRQGVSDDLEELTGLGRRPTVASVLLTAALLSLAGLPLTIGFVGRLSLIGGLVAGGERYLGLLGIATVANLLSLYYYLRVLRRLYLDGATERSARQSDGWSRQVISLLVLGALLLGGLPWTGGGLLRLAQQSLGAPGEVLRASPSFPPTDR